MSNIFENVDGSAASTMSEPPLTPENMDAIEFEAIEAADLDAGQWNELAGVVKIAAAVRLCTKQEMVDLMASLGVEDALSSAYEFSQFRERLEAMADLLREVETRFLVIGAAAALEERLS